MARATRGTCYALFRVLNARPSFLLQVSPCRVASGVDSGGGPWSAALAILPTAASLFIIRSSFENKPPSSYLPVPSVYIVRHAG